MDRQKLAEAFKSSGAWFSGRGPAYERIKALNEHEREEGAKEEVIRRIILSQQLLANGDVSGAQANMVEGAQAWGGTKGGDAMRKAAMMDALEFPAFLEQETKLLQKQGKIATPESPSWSGQKVGSDGNLYGIRSDQPGMGMQQIPTQGGVTFGGSNTGSDWTSTVDGNQVIWRNNRTQESYAEPIRGMTTPEEPPLDPKQMQDVIEKARSVIRGAKDDFAPVEANYRTIQAANKNPSAAGDLGIVIGYMKMLDPTSVVREGEQAMVRNAAGALEAPARLIQQLQSGESLTPDQRKGVLDASRELYKTRSALRDATIFDRMTFAVGDGIPVERVMNMYAKERWDRKDFVGVDQQGKEHKFSLSDIYATAARRGIPALQIVQMLNIEGGIYK